MRSSFSGNMLSLIALALVSLPIASEAQTAGIGTPVRAQLGVPVQVDPTEGLQALPWENLRAEWSWDSRPMGSTAEFDDSDAYRPSFTPDEPGTYVALATFFSIGDTGSTNPLHVVQVDVGTGNLAPVARIRTRGFPTGSTPIQVDGSGSYDVNGDGLNYLWSLESAPWGSQASFADPTAPVTHLRFDWDGDYTIGLTVEDQHSATSAMALLTIKYNATYGGTTDVYRRFFDRTFNSEPSVSNLFELGDISTDPAQDRMISGFRLANGSEPFPDTVAFDFDSLSWSLSTPQSFLDLAEYLESHPQGAATARVSPDTNLTDLTYVFGDLRGSLTFRNLLGPDLPRQDAIDAGALFYEGSGSHHVPPVPSTRFEQLPAEVSQLVFVDPYETTDMDGETLGISWGLSIAPEGASSSLGWHSDGLTSVTPTGPGDYVVTLRAQDWLYSGLDRILISAGSDPEIRPVAVIAPITYAPLNSPVLLDGSQSYDLNGELMSWSWALLSRPSGSSATIADASAPRAQFSPDQPGIYVVQLQVEDGASTSLPATMPIRAVSPLPVASAGPDLLPDFFGEATVNSSASVPGVAQQIWRSLRIGENAEHASIDDPEAIATNIGLARRSTQLHEAVKNWPIYHFSGRSPDPGYCDYDARLPSNLPDANPSEPVSLTLTGLGQVWSVSGLSQVWQIENAGEYTRSITLVDENSTIYGTYSLPGEVTLFVLTPDTESRSLTVEVDSTPVATAWGQSWPYANWSTFACTTPGSNLFQVSVANDLNDGTTGFAAPSTVFVGYTNLRPVVNPPSDLSVTIGEPVVLTGTDYSHDANGGGLNYSWALTHRPAGSSTTLDGTAINQFHFGPEAEFTPDAAGIYLVQIIAADAEFISVPGAIVIDAGGEPPPCRTCSVRTAP